MYNRRTAKKSYICNKIHLLHHPPCKLINDLNYLKTILATLLLLPLSLNAQTDPKLTGKVIGTTMCYDYSKGQTSTQVNTAANCFDGDLSTFFATNARNNTWAGLDLGTPHVITRVGWSPRNDGNGPSRVQLAVFEGANRADFSDAVPLYIVPNKGTIGTISHADLTATQAFRYVRYIGPHDARCNVAEVEFYGHEGEVTSLDPVKGEAQKVDAALLYRPTNLPVVSIHTENYQEPYDKEHEIACFISIISDGKVLCDTATIRLRGNASMNFEKKPYRIKWDEKHRVLDSPAKAKKWTLINNYGDKTLMRNMLAFDLSRRFEMAYTPFCTPVDVILNGEYKGCYQLCDQIEVNKNRVNITEMDATCDSGEALTGGYLIEIDAYAEGEDVYFWSSKGNPVTIKSPDSDEILQVQKDYIQQHFNDMESRLFGTRFTETGSAGYRVRLDLESFLKHFLVGELSGNTDTYWSVNMYKQRGDDLLYTGPVWDFDLAFDNDNRTYPISNKTDWIYRSGGSCAGKMRNFVDRIVRDDTNAIKTLERLWSDARWNGLSAESLCDYVDENAKLLEASQQLNFVRWPIMSQYVHQNPRIHGSYAAEVENVKNYLKKRVEWIDKKLHFDATGIDTPIYNTRTQEEDAIYTLSGQRVEGTLSPGIYIRGGKKVIK